MWIAILVVGVCVAIGHAIYFGRRITRALAVVLPGTQRWHRAARRAHLVLACSVPVLLVGFILYALVARPDRIAPPDGWAYSYLVELPFWMVTIWSLQVTLLVLPIDLLHGALARFGVAAGQRWVWRRSALVLAIAGGFALYVPVRALAVDGRGLDVRTHEVAVRDLPPALDGLRIALVADMQADQYTGEERLAQLVDAVNREAPDLVVIAGDMITRAPSYADMAARAAGRMRARLGVLACIGDHENFAYRDRARSVREVREAMERHGVPMLDNEVRTLRVGDATIAVVLATNNYVSRIAPDAAARLLATAHAADLRVLCAHQATAPLLAAARDAGVELFLAGHTHGGQVNFWLPFLDLTPARFETPYITGAHRIGDMMLVVTSGLGMSVAPLRYRSPPTIDIVHLARTTP